MAKLRRNHNKKGSSVSMIRVVVYLIVIVIMMYYLYQSVNKVVVQNPSLFKREVPVDSSFVNHTIDDYFPCQYNGELINHRYYSLSYNEKAEQAEWVAYRLTKESLKVPNVNRTNYYNPDYAVSTGSAFHKDYTGSGYSRGHLAPAGDMAFSKEAMEESFFMSNMSPQLRAFNGGIWKELEEQIRDWAFQKKALIIVTGPMLNRKIIKSIGKNEVKVPSSFFKIILNVKSSPIEAISFIIPNKLSKEKLSSYISTIDEIESELDLDFFCTLLEEEQSIFESQTNFKSWNFSERRFNLRVSKWNRQ